MRTHALRAGPAISTMSNRAESAASSCGASAAVAPRSKRAVLYAAALLILAHAVALVCLARRTGTTVDEPILLAGGRMILEEGWKDPYTRFQGPLPLYPNQIFTQGRTVAPFPDDETIFLGRLGLLPFALLASLVLFLWSRAAFGDAAGLLSLALWATHPMALGYGSLLAVDAAHAAFVLLALFLAWRYLRAPGVARFACASIAIGAALATKYLALLFAPAGFAAIALGAWRSGTGSAWRRAVRSGAALAGAGSLALLALHASYGFAPGFAPRTSAAYESGALQRWIEIPVLGHALAALPRPFLEGIDYQRDIAGKVDTTYFNGSFANGHPAYYAGALFWKSPEILFVALAVALVCAAARWRSTSSAARTTWLVAAIAITVPLVYLSFWNALQIGIRYALPILPLLCLLAGACLRRDARGRAFFWPAVVLVLGTIELATTWPEMLGYYNRTSGGAALAWKRFADSNSDWGHLERRGLEDLRARHPEPFQVLKASDGPRFGRVALHVSQLVPHDPRDPSRSYSWLDELRPADHAGAAWFLFDVGFEDLERSSRTGDPRRRRDFAVALLGSDRFREAQAYEVDLSPEERPIFARIQALRSADSADPLASALELSELWLKLQRHDLAEATLRDPHFASDPRARARVIELLVAQQRRDEAIALLERDAELLSEEPHMLLLFLLYGEVARYGDAIRFLEPRLAGLSAPVRAEAERRLVEMRRLNAAGERYHQRR